MNPSAWQTLTCRELPRHVRSDAAAFFRRVYAGRSGTKRSQAVFAGLVGGIATSTNRDAMLDVERLCVQGAPALLIRQREDASAQPNAAYEMGTRVVAVLIALETSTHNPREWSDRDLGIRYWTLSRTCNGEIRVQTIDRSLAMRECGVANSLDEALRELCGPLAVGTNGVRAIHRSGADLTITFEPGIAPSFGTACLTCGRSCASDSCRMLGGKALSAKAFARRTAVWLPWCRRCQRRSTLRNVVILVSAGASAFIGYWIANNVLGMWPTNRTVQKWTILAMSVPGMITAYVAWGDPDAPVRIKQHADRLEITFESQRVSRQFRAAHRTLFDEPEA